MDDSTVSGIAAVVLAAGRSRRMGSPKMVLPWGARTVIGQVVSTLYAAGVSDIVVVTGGAREVVEEALSGSPVRFCFNPEFAGSEMISSLKIGLAQFDPSIQAGLVVLGDQPFLSVDTIKKILHHYTRNQTKLVVPSYHMRRGHPWIIDRALWSEIFTLSAEQTLRDFLNLHSADIGYVTVDTPDILKDLDTPEDYRRERPQPD